MDLSPHIEAIRADIQALSAPDEAGQGAAERLGRALEPSLQLRMLDALGEASMELSDQVPGGHVEVRLAARDASLVFVDERPQVDEGAPDDEEGGTARITLRMPEHLKTKVEEVATKEGLSTNAWLVRAVARALEARRVEVQIGRTRSGTRITGFAQS
jgi:hypothetical protein